MPELDVISRKLDREWRKPYELLKGGAPLETVADALVEALVSSFRRNGGIPGFPDLVAAAGWCESGRGSSRSLGAMTRQVEARFDQHHLTKIAARSVHRHSVRLEARTALPGSPARNLAIDTCHGILESAFFGRVLGKLAGKRFATAEEGENFREACLRTLKPELLWIGTALGRDPTAKSLRRPPQRRKRRSSTRELLDEPLD